MSNMERDYTPDDEAHSDIVGGSTAARVMGCPASVGMLAKMQGMLDNEAFDLELKAQDEMAAGHTVEAEALNASANRIKASLNQSSSYADEGTKLHEIMALLVDQDIPLTQVHTNEAVAAKWAELELDDDLMFDAVIPAYRDFTEYCDKLLDESNGPMDELRIMVEAHCEMPGIEGAFGTTDVLIRAPKRTVIWDWKFGAGVKVYASYTRKRLALPSEVPSEEIGGDNTTVDEFGNDQLCFYGRAAMNSFPDYFEPQDDWPVDLVICQPRIGEGTLEETGSPFTVTVADLEDFRLDLIDAVEEALGPSPTMKRDDKWCRFAACKSICPLHMNAPGQMVDLAEKLKGIALSASVADNAELPVAEYGGRGISYAEALAILLDLSDILEPMISEARAQGHNFLEAGGTIPGYKLVPKRAGWDKWKDEKKTDAYLARQGLSVEDRRKPWASITPAVARTKLKALKGKAWDDEAKKRLEKYVEPGVSSGTTLAPDSDSRIAVPATATQVAELAGKLAQIAGRT